MDALHQLKAAINDVRLQPPRRQLLVLPETAFIELLQDSSASVRPDPRQVGVAVGEEEPGLPLDAADRVETGIL